MSWQPLSGGWTCSYQRAARAPSSGDTDVARALGSSETAVGGTTLASKEAALRIALACAVAEHGSSKAITLEPSDLLSYRLIHSVKSQMQWDAGS